MKKHLYLIVLALLTFGTSLAQRQYPINIGYGGVARQSADGFSATFAGGSASQSNWVNNASDNAYYRSGFNPNILFVEATFDKPLFASKGYFANYVELRWEVANYETQITRFDIYRKKLDSTVPEQLVASISANDRSWRDEYAEAGTLYSYSVVAKGVFDLRQEFVTQVTGIGFRIPYGQVSGRIVYAGGTAVEGVRVSAQSEDQFTNTSLYLNGTDAYLSVPAKVSNPKLNFDTAMTFQGWFRPASIDQTVTLFEKGNQYRLNYTNSQLSFTAGGQTVDLDFPVQANEYFHVIAMRTADSLHLMVKYDPEKVYTTAVAFTSSTPASSDPIVIGKGQNGGFFKGHVDEIRIWYKSHNKTKILQQAEQYISGLENGLSAYFRINEGTGSSVYDLSRLGFEANENHATVVNSTWTNIIPGNTQLAVKGITDASGNYLISGIPFATSGSSYTITPFFGTHKFDPNTQTLYIGPGANNYSKIDFIDVSSFTVKGYVYYKNTEYPVSGVSIRVDGKQAINSDGTLILSKSTGEFSFQVPIGQHYFMLEKYGHKFENARFPSDSGTVYDFNQDLTFDSKTQRILDTTLIKVVGKVVGGPYQAALPNGMDKTTNNIGNAKISLTTQAGVSLILNDATSGVDATILHHYYSDGVKKEKGNSTRLVIDKNNRSFLDLYPDEESGQYTAYLLPEKYTITQVTAGAQTPVPYYTFDQSYNGVIDLTQAFNNTTETDTVKGAMYLTPQGDTAYYKTIDSTSFQRKHDFILRVKPSIEVTNKYGQPNFWESKVKTRSGEEVSVVNEQGYPITNWPIFVQRKPYEAVINVFEEYVNVNNGSISDQVPVSDGVVDITNAFSIYPEKQTFELNENGKVNYRFKGGLPKLIGDRLQGLQIVALTGSGGTIITPWKYTPPIGGNANGEFNAYLLGAVPTGNNFVSKGPNEIDMIIRDPQGSNSFSYYSSGNTLSKTESYELSTELSMNNQLKLDFGAKVTTFVGLGVGVIEEAEVIANTTIGLEASTAYLHGNSTSTSVTNTSTWSTSSSPDYIGANGDVFIGRSTNIVYGLSNELTFIKNNTCDENAGDICISKDGSLFKLDQAQDLRVAPEFSTAFQYTQSFIKDQLIPNLKELKRIYLTSSASKYFTSHITNADDERYFATNTTNNKWAYSFDKKNFTLGGDNYSISFSINPAAPNYFSGGTNFVDSVYFYNSQIKSWEEALAKNEKEKIEAKLLDNYSLDAGVGLAKERSEESSETTTNNVSWSITPSFELEVGFEIFSIGSEATITRSVTVAGSHTFEGTSTNTVTHGFELADEDAGDYFSIDVKKPQAATGLVFSTRGGASKCPYEGATYTEYYNPGTVISQATVQQEKPEIGAVQASQYDVPADKPAFFNIKLGNGSQTNADGWFMVAVDEASNNQGAIIKMDGQPIGNGLAVFIPAGVDLDKVITIQKNLPAINTYDNIGIIIKSTCQDDISDTIRLTARFQPVCTTVNLSSPNDQWVMNDNNTNRVLNVIIDGFSKDFVGFTGLILQTKPTNQSTWTTQAKYKNGSLTSGDSIAIGDNSVLLFPLDLSSYPDRAYDIRAYSTCANGTTNYSQTLSGMKDTKRPQVFGSPSPGDGILSPGEDISVSFNENIFTTDNFEASNLTVRGVLNDAKIDHNSVLSFDGIDDYVKIDAPADLNNRSWSTEMWVKRTEINKQQVLFSLGEVEFGFSASNEFYLTADSITYTGVESSTNKFNFTDKWIHLSVSYDADNRRLNAFKAYGEISEPIIIDNDSILGDAKFGGELFFGNSTDGTKPYKGYMHDARLWGKAINGNDAIALKDNILKGDEINLIGLWPMNELTGTLANDLARSQHGEISGAEWQVLPMGRSLKLPGNGNVLLPSPLPITKSMDFTVELWFKGNKAEASNSILLSNGKTDGSEVASVFPKVWEIGFNTEGKLYAKNNNVAIVGDKDFLDDKWHHIALVLRRKSNTSLYIDGVLEKQTASSVFGSFEGSNVTLGSSRSATLASNPSNFFKGYVDECRIWNLARTTKQLDLDRFSKLSGDEIGLLSYYPFDVYNTVNKVTESTLSSQRLLRTVTNIGTVSLEPDTAIATMLNSDFEMNIVPKIKLARPVQGLNYSTIVSNDKVVIKLNDNPSLLEKTTVEVTIQQVEDQYGNTMASPETWTAFVRNNTVLWTIPNVSLVKKVNEPLSFDVEIENIGGTSENYEVSNLPAWLTVSQPSGTINPLSKNKLTFSIHPAINIGNYIETLYLTTGFGFNENFELALKVIGDPPKWEINPENFSKSMNVIATLKIDGILSTDEDDMVAAYVGGELRGVAPLRFFPQLSSYLALIDIYSNVGTGEVVTFNVWDASIGKLHIDVTPQLNFSENEIIGTATDPIILNATNILSEPIPLKKGWNWISFPLNSLAHPKSQDLFAGMTGIRTSDLIKSQTNFDIFNTTNVWSGSLTAKGGVNNRELYKMYISGIDTIKYKGKQLDPKVDSLTISLKTGWNWIGFPVLQNLSIEDAFSKHNPMDGDVIKGQVGFSIFSGQQGWVGSLQTLMPKKGYMYKSKVNGSFKYPTSSSFKSYQGEDPIYAIQKGQDLDEHSFSSNMTLVAELDEQETVNGIRVIAHHNGEIRGVSQLVDNKFFITLYGQDDAEELSFIVVDQNNTFHTAIENVNFVGDEMLGSLEKPFVFHLTTDGSMGEIAGVKSAIYPTVYRDVVHFDLALQSSSQVAIEIFDVLGKKIATVFEGEKTGGRHQIQWINSFGTNLASGVHIARVTVDGNIVSNTRLIHVK